MLACTRETSTIKCVCVRSFVRSFWRKNWALPTPTRFPGLQGPDPFSTPRGDWDLFYKEKKVGGFS